MVGGHQVRGYEEDRIGCEVSISVRVISSDVVEFLSTLPIMFLFFSARCFRTYQTNLIRSHTTILTDAQCLFEQVTSSMHQVSVIFGLRRGS